MCDFAWTLIWVFTVKLIESPHVDIRFQSNDLMEFYVKVVVYKYSDLAAIVCIELVKILRCKVICWSENGRGKIYKKICD